MVVDERKQTLESHSQDKSESKYTENPADNKNQEIEKILRAEVEALQSFIREYQASNKASTRIQWLSFWVTLFTALVVAAYTAVTRSQLGVMRETFEEQQRAAVYLARPDGKFAEFLPEENPLRVALYFRNIGPNTARRTVIDIWMVTYIPDGSRMKTVFEPLSPVRDGPNISPGAPYTVYQFYRAATREELNTGKKRLHVIGRVAYDDIFRHHCEQFALEYSTDPLRADRLSGFTFTSYLNIDLCDEKKDEVETLTFR